MVLQLRFYGCVYYKYGCVYCIHGCVYCVYGFVYCMYGCVYVWVCVLLCLGVCTI